MGQIQLSGVRKSFGDVEVIKGVDLTIDEGGLVIFVGPSGCGKSTLLRLVSGLEEVTEGTIAIDGVDVTGKPPAERGLSMVFQSYALYPHKTVRQNMGFGLQVARAPKAEIAEKVAVAAETLQLDALLDRRPKEEEGGAFHPPIFYAEHTTMLVITYSFFLASHLGIFGKIGH